MEPSEQNCCVCCEFLSSSEITTRTRDILEILKFLLINVNHKLLQDSIICESCLAKLQSAYKFKILYSEGFQKSLDNTTVESGTNLAKFLMCGICKKILDPSDSVPFDYSLSIRSTLIKHFPMEFESKVPDNVHTCEECHKLLLNFCTITNSVSIFEQNSAVINEFDNTEHRQYFQNTHDIYNSNSHNFKFDIKEEGACEFQDTKDVDCILQDMKQENEDSNYQEFVLKNEAIDLKTDVNSEDEMNLDPDAQNVETISDLPVPIQHFDSNETTRIVDKMHEHTETASTSEFGTVILTHKVTDKTEGVFHCYNCTFRTTQKGYIKKHMLKHKNVNDIDMFQCPICNYQSRYKHALQGHMRQHKNIDDIEMLQCPVCAYQTIYKHELRGHMLKHKNVNKTEIFNCPTCEYQTRYKHALNRHVMKHKNIDEIELFECYICRLHFNEKSSFVKHINLVHKNSDDIEMFQCNVCNFQSTLKSRLKSHLLIHKRVDEIETFKCQSCKFQTRYKSSISRHMQTHGDFKDIEFFQCHMCIYQSKCRSKLKRHMLVHKTDDEVEMFQCQICEFRTKRKHTLKGHMLVHRTVDEIEMFHCQNCSYQNKSKRALKQHMLKKHKK